MKSVWILTTFGYDAYSYRGVSAIEMRVFASRDAAEKWATQNKYEIVYQSDDPIQAELDEYHFTG